MHRAPKILSAAQIFVSHKVGLINLQILRTQGMSTRKRWSLVQQLLPVEDSRMY